MNKLQLDTARCATSFVPLALAFAGIAASFSACGEFTPRGKYLRYEIVALHPHDATSFTQGLAMLDGLLVESRGLNGHSAVAIQRVDTGVVLKRHALAPEYFGEGLAVAGRRLLQITWQSGVAFEYDEQLRPLRTLRYDGEGWGLAFDGRRWLMSDGSDRITLRHLDTFARIGEIRVTDGGRPLRQLNELEYAQGRLYANVWHSDSIAVIDPATGVVASWLDLAVLRKGFPPKSCDQDQQALNGIAYDSTTGHFLVTGKCWPVLYEIRLVPP